MHDDNPAFLFYPRDWLAATRGLTPETRAAYVDLLAVAWLDDGLEDDPDALRRIAGVSPRAWGGVWPKLAAKFPIAADGRRRNARQEEVRERRTLYLSQCRAGGAKRAASGARQSGRFTSQTTSAPPADTPAHLVNSWSSAGEPAGVSAGEIHQPEHQPDTSIAFALKDLDQDQDPATADAAAAHQPVETVEISGRRLASEPPRPAVIARLVLDLLEQHADDVEPYRDADLKEDLKRACARQGLAYHADAVRKAIDAAEAQWRRRKRPA